jgi:hypothetical protein
MLYVGLDLSRKRLHFHASARTALRSSAAPSPADRDGLARLVYRLGGHDGDVAAVIESMNGARFVHDQLEAAGFDVEIADAQRVKGLAPLACKTDRIDAWVLAELARRDLVPAIWLPDPSIAPSVSAPLPAPSRPPAHAPQEPRPCHIDHARPRPPGLRPVRAPGPRGSSGWRSPSPGGGRSRRA